MKAPFRYHGGKQRSAQWIAAQLPQMRGYMEPFAGMCSVLLARPPVKSELVNDPNDNIWAFWTTVRDQPGWLQHRLAATPHNHQSIFTEAQRQRLSFTTRWAPGTGM